MWADMYKPDAAIIHLGATKEPMDFAMAVTPAFDAAYALWPALPCSPAMEASSTIEPDFLRIIDRAAAWTV